MDGQINMFTCQFQQEPVKEHPKVGDVVFVVRWRHWEYEGVPHKELGCMKCRVAESDGKGNFIAVLYSNVFLFTSEDHDWFWIRETAKKHYQKILENDLWDIVK